MSLQGVQTAPCMPAEPTLSLQNLDLDQPTSLSDILGLSPRNSPIDENHPGFKEVKTLQVSKRKVFENLISKSKASKYLTL